MTEHRKQYLIKYRKKYYKEHIEYYTKYNKIWYKNNVLRHRITARNSYRRIHNVDKKKYMRREND